jgi:predicted nucleic acid-binding protein
LIVVFDASVLVYILDENANAPIDQSTGQPVAGCKERVEHLIASLQRDNAKIIIPTPSLGEILVKAQTAAPEWLRILNSSRHFRIAPFDQRAAVEFAATQANRPAAARRTTSRHKAKFDDQIVAIASVEGATVIYSDDGDIKKLESPHLKVIGIAELPLPPVDPQGSLPLVERE